MSDTPETDAWIKAMQEQAEYEYPEYCRKLERQRDENKRGWDRASLAALQLEQRAKRAEKCILAIEEHYRTKCAAYLQRVNYGEAD